jgi:hypothetical protein
LSQPRTPATMHRRRLRNTQQPGRPPGPKRPPTVEEQIQALRQECRARSTPQDQPGRQGCAVEAGAAGRSRCAGCGRPRRKPQLPPAAGGQRQRRRRHHAAVHRHRPQGQPGFAGHHRLRRDRQDQEGIAAPHVCTTRASPSHRAASPRVKPLAHQGHRRRHSHRLQRFPTRAPMPIRSASSTAAPASRASPCMAEGKTSWGTLRGYYEADWLGTGITSNNNQSNSYVCASASSGARPRPTATGPSPAASCGRWLLKTRRASPTSSGDIMTPLTIDPNYVVGFVWTRQYGFRVTKTFEHAPSASRLRTAAPLHRLAGRQHALRRPRQRRHQRRQLQRRHQHLLAFHLHRQLHQPEGNRLGRQHHRHCGSGLQDRQRMRQHRQHLLQPGARHHRQGRLRSRLGPL